MHLLRIEGVNHAHCIDDTEDLSTRRGGSLMLLDAIESVKTEFGSRLKAISTGASTGLFEVLAPTPADIAEGVRQFLSMHPLYRHGTFMVDMTQGGDFRNAETEVLNANRWQQMRRLSFATAGLIAQDTGPCAVDEVRPVTAWRTVKGNAETGISTSVADRRQHGLDKKRWFYADELARLATAHRPTWSNDSQEYSRDFEDIAAEPVEPVHPHTLVGKLAVFYADGNSFGAQVRACETPEALTAWEGYLKTERRRFLAALIERARNTPRWQTKNKALRLETLLWGGDELMIAVPGWCGLELAELFFESTRHLQYPAADGTPLTHACGLVFCHQQAPISRIGALTKKLADCGKAGPLDAQGKPGKRRNQNTLHWMVLENFDQAGGDLDAYLRMRHASHEINWARLELSPVAVTQLAAALPVLKELLPRSAMVRATRLMAEAQAVPDDPHPLLRRSYQQVGRGLKAGGDNEAQLWKTCWATLHPLQRPWPDTNVPLDNDAAWRQIIQPADLAAWITLLELWDYCPERQSNADFEGISNAVAAGAGA